MTPPKPKPMHVNRALVDKDFDRYVLSTSNAQRSEIALAVPVLPPQSATPTLRKAQWEARLHHNALAADPFLSSEANGKKLAVGYFVNSNDELVQVRASEDSGVQTVACFQFPRRVASADRRENVSIAVAGTGLLVVSDGAGMLSFLKAVNPTQAGMQWTQVYECAPFGVQSALLVLGARYDEVLQRFHVLVAEFTDAAADNDMVYRLSMVDVAAAETSPDAMDTGDEDKIAVGLVHQVTEIALVSALPSYVSFVDSRLVLLAQGKYDLVMDVAEQTQPVVTIVQPATDENHAHKRHHDESELEADIEEVLKKLPRAGIGYQGDISGVKHPHELAVDLSVPLEQRFHKSSTPFSSLDTPLHDKEAGAAGTETTQERLAREGKLEVVTPDDILGGFEECDEGDPNATATFILIDLKQKRVQQTVDLDCRQFRFLCSSAPIVRSGAVATTLLFQNDVHGLVYTISIEHDGSNAKLTLQHESTLPAFGFVQASKQDKKFMTIHATGSLACIGEFEKRVFVYHGAASTEELAAHTRKQRVLEIGDQPLLGLRMLSSSALMILTSERVYALFV